MSLFVKICGVKTPKSAKEAIDAGASFIGLNFAHASSRYVTPEVAREIIGEERAPSVSYVGVFQNERPETVNDIAHRLNLDFVQLHGDESPDYCRTMIKPVIKAIGLTPDFDIEETATNLRAYAVSYILLDRKERKGAVLPYEKVAKLAELFPVILAGGLTPETVGEAVRLSGPLRGVDVAGGVETDGEKDVGKMKKFIEMSTR